MSQTRAAVMPTQTINYSWSIVLFVFFAFCGLGAV
jgi:hypothetical protein